MSYRSGYNDGWYQAKANQSMREFLDRERAAGRGVTAKGLGSLLVLAVCLAVPTAAVWGLHVSLGKMEFFVEHPLLVKFGYGVVAVVLFSVCATFHKAIRAMLALAFLAALLWALWGGITALALDGVH
jgi:hypothetical protein